MTLDYKMFVQLQPDKADIEHVVSLQQRLPFAKGHIMVAASELHVTVIHIGKLTKLWNSLPPEVTVSEAEFLQRATKLAKDLRLRCSEESTIPLSPESWGGFGPTGSTLVVTYRVTSRLNALHADSLQLLQSFLADCGVQNIEVFMQQDTNLQYALTCRPHIALARNYKQPLPELALQPVTFRTMPIIYSS